MCVYVHVYMCVHVCPYVYMCMCTCVCMCVHVCVYVQVYMHVCKLGTSVVLVLHGACSFYQAVCTSQLICATIIG